MTQAALVQTDMTINYRGPLITDTSIPGVRKADGIIPAHPGGGALQLSADRWIIFYAGLDPRGWDANHSIPCFGARAVEDLATLNHANGEAGEIVVAARIHARQLGRLTAE